MFAESSFAHIPADREAARVLSKVPVEVPADPTNIIWCFDGRTSHIKPETLRAIPGQVGEVETDAYDTAFSLIVPDGKRLIIDNIPKGNKDDEAAGDAGRRMQVQVYHNNEGFLVADKVMSGEIIKMRAVNVSVDPETGMRLDHTKLPQRAMDSLATSNDRKSEAVDPLDPSRRTVHLLSTTAMWTSGATTYGRSEIEISTPDDAGNQVGLYFTSADSLESSAGPIVLRMADDSSAALADPMYQ